MPTPIPLLSAIGKAAVEGVEAGGARALVGPDAKLAQAVWASWAAANQETDRAADIQAVARLTTEELEAAAVGILMSKAASLSAQTIHAVRGYFRWVPPAIRRALRRPSDPQGFSAPPGWRMREVRDLVALLPVRMPWFDLGDRPFGIGDWELSELLEVEAAEETWKAFNPRKPEGAPVALQFFHDAAAKESLRQMGTAPWDPVRQLTAQPGWVQFKEIYVQADPPCVEWAFVPSGDLCGLVREWQAAGTTGLWREISQLIQQLANTLAPAHQLQPPLVHRGLNASSVRARGETGWWTSQIALMGLSAGISAKSGVGGTPQPNASPQQQRGDPPDPRDDVFALGVLWHQLLTRDLTVGRPEGSQWRRRILDDGVPQNLIDLLESCLDEGGRRPANAGELAQKLEAALKQGTAPALPRSRSVDLGALLGTPVPAPAATSELAVPARESASKPRSRRADVQQLFQTLEQEVKERPKLFTNSLDIKMVLLPSATCSMGSPPEEAGRRDNEGPRHEVQLPNGLYLAIHTVTQAQYQKLIGRNPARFDTVHGGGPDHPVENVSWEEAVEFCRRLSAMPAEKAAGRKYRLPTEAEWEYACRAGSETPFAFGLSLSDSQANFNGRFPYGGAAHGDFAEKTLPVGSFPPNNFGLCDMHGNVWEWCADWLNSDYYGRSPKRNPQGPEAGSYRVIRGGSWQSHAATCRCAYRNGLSQGSRDRFTGFRVAADVE
jgi:formylglycine-generating enzyme required for sulfatase activity